MKTIHLPCLRGSFGDWVYFSTIMKVSDVVENKRIITVPESQELYTKNINQILQREIDLTRIKKIKNYLILNNERFFSSLILAIHKGDPKWADFDLEKQYKIDNQIIDDNDVDFIQNKIGILTLTGEEEIFVLDGQHRLLGLRAAAKENVSVLKDEITTILIIHKSEFKERTRRLFTVLNRYAVSIKPAEKVILEEDDAAAILTRKLVQEYPLFLLDNSVSSSKLLNLPPSDIKSFTTLVCLYEISKVLIDYKTLYRSKVIIRPADVELDKLYKRIIAYWDYFFSTFPQIVNFIKGDHSDGNFIRNSENGGSLLLRPEAQKLIASLFADFTDQKKGSYFKNVLGEVDFYLSSNNWRYVFWTGEKMERGKEKLKRAIFKYILRAENAGDEKFINEQMTKIYKDKELNFDMSIFKRVAK